VVLVHNLQGYPLYWKLEGIQNLNLNFSPPLPLPTFIFSCYFGKNQTVSQRNRATKKTFIHTPPRNRSNSTFHNMLAMKYQVLAIALLLCISLVPGADGQLLRRQVTAKKNEMALEEAGFQGPTAQHVRGLGRSSDESMDNYGSWSSYYSRSSSSKYRFCRIMSLSIFSSIGV
jgi:hypothetical protein